VHHFASKHALFEAVLDLLEARVTAEVIAAASTADPWDAAMLALDTYLTHCCDPVYGRRAHCRRSARFADDRGRVDARHRRGVLRHDRNPGAR
jgi:AcrR family transcriptional regulator